MNMNKEFEIISNLKLVPVIKIDNIEDTLPLAKALKNGGAGVLEITFRTQCAPEAIAIAKKNFPELLVGAGTIINAAQAELAISSKADFIVSPGFSIEVANVCKNHNILYLPGVITPTEIISAIDAGITKLKFFPCSNFGGLDTLKSYGAVFPSVQFMPTGGISETNINDYLKLSNVFACGGSWIVPTSALKAKDFDKIEALTKKAMEIIK